MKDPYDLLRAFVESEMLHYGRKFELKLNALYETQKQMSARIDYLFKEMTELKSYANKTLMMANEMMADFYKASLEKKKVEYKLSKNKLRKRKRHK